MRRIILAWILNRVTIGDLIWLLKKIMKRDRVKEIEFDVQDKHKKLRGKVHWVKIERA